MKTFSVTILLLVFTAITAHAQDGDATPDFGIFAAHDADNTQSIDYSEISAYLGLVTIEDRNRTEIYYAGMGKDSEAYLNGVIGFMASVDPRSLNRNEQLAYWLNLHNLMILRAYAGQNPRRIENDRGVPSAPGKVWADKSVTVAGTPLSLQDIESRVLAANWSNPDVLYGIYQGAEGGPKFSREAFSGADINERLSQLGDDYVNGRGNVRARKDTVHVSEFYQWYKDAFFGGEDRAILDHLAAHAQSGKDREKISAAQDIEFRNFDYTAESLEPRRQVSPALPAVRGGGGIGS